MLGKSKKTKKKLQMLSDVTSKTTEDLKSKAGDRSGCRVGKNQYFL